MPINLIKAITNQTKNSFVVSSFIYTMNCEEKLEMIWRIVDDDFHTADQYILNSLEDIKKIIES